MKLNNGPVVIAISGPNGAGKTTLAPLLLRDSYGLLEYVNADPIAQGLSGFGAANAAREAGRIMLKRIDSLVAKSTDFAFETTLSGRSYVDRIRGMRDSGYKFHLVYLWLDSADLCVQRVNERIRGGGHSVPEATIRRRYLRGIQNFFYLYQPLADSWALYDNSFINQPILIANGGKNRTLRVLNRATWQRIQIRVK